MRFQFTAGVRCSVCELVADVVEARSWEAARDGEGVCLACVEARGKDDGPQGDPGRAAISAEPVTESAAVGATHVRPARGRKVQGVGHAIDASTAELGEAGAGSETGVDRAASDN